MDVPRRRNVDFAEDEAGQEVAAASEKTKVIKLKAPITEEQIRQLKVGDVVQIDGRIYTGRDALHKYLMDNDAR